MSTDSGELERLRAENQALKDDAAARDLYGSAALGGATGGGTPPSGSRRTEDEAFVQDFQARLTSETGQVTMGEIERYQRTLGGAHLAVGLARNSQVFARHGITEEVLAKAGYGADPMEPVRSRNPARQKPGNIPKRRRR